MARGIVKKWFADRGTGFLIDNADQADVFFGDRGLSGGLTPAMIEPGMEVEFDRKETPRGPQARNVRPARDSRAPHGSSPTATRPPASSRNQRNERMNHGRPSPPEPLHVIAVPESVRTVLTAVDGSERHPGLQLDRFLVPGDQKRQRESIEDVCRTLGNESLLREVFSRREHQFHLSNARQWNRVTNSLLTLHLSRANALENAGICLHPVYGFAYLPGSGLKGMARAFAETIWLPQQENPHDSWRLIEDIFGWASNVRRRQLLDDQTHPAAPRRQSELNPNSPELSAHAGNVVFHDAWPVRWPQLAIDITNNHHPKYYDGEDAPGDWENPNPVYFLTVSPGTDFHFIVAGRRDDTDSKLLESAQEWLDGALTVLGAGAKTSAGYGAFAPIPDSPRIQLPPLQQEARYTLELVTPAFFAGASQQGADCELRPASIRGQLRWWWRTLHAGFLTTPQLHALESAIWGDTKRSSPVQLQLTSLTPSNVVLYEHPAPAGRQNISGMRYVAYGMDEMVREQGQRTRKQRYQQVPGARWEVRFRVRNAELDMPDSGNPSPKSVQLTTEQVAGQVRAAFWLFTRFGGVGAKARKGFGSLSVTGHSDDSEFASFTIQRCQELAAELRVKSLQVTREFDPDLAEGSALSGPSSGTVVEVPVATSHPETVMELIGLAYSDFASSMKHQTAKVALGLPRKIHGPTKDALPHQNRDEHRPPKDLSVPKTTQGRPQDARFAAPIHLHVEKTSGGHLVRLLTFPQQHLPDVASSTRVLSDFSKRFRAGLASLDPAGIKMTATRQKGQTAASTPGGPKPGDRVEAVLSSQKTKKGGWTAAYRDRNGPIQNSADVPSDKNADETVTLIVRVFNEKDIAFRWPTAADDAKSGTKKKKNR